MFRLQNFAILFATRSWSFQFTRIGRTSIKLYSEKRIGSDTTYTEQRDSYLFGDGDPISFEQLGINDIILKSLQDAGKPFATSIQASCYETIVSGRDCIIGAETGSGKTLAYLLPLLHKLITDNVEPSKYPTAIIMVPNKELCFQVNTVANEISQNIRKNGFVLNIDAETYISGEWPYRRSLCPQVLVCTPSFLSSFLSGPVVLEEELFRSIKYMILDEADMLLEGSYLAAVERIFDAFKVTRRQMIREGDVEVHESTLQCILSAATLPTYGIKSIENYVKKRFPNAVRISNRHMHKQHPRIVQEFIPLRNSNLCSDERIDIVLSAISSISTGSASSTSASSMKTNIRNPSSSTQDSSSSASSSSSDDFSLEDLMNDEMTLTSQSKHRQFSSNTITTDNNNNNNNMHMNNNKGDETTITTSNIADTNSNIKNNEEIETSTSTSMSTSPALTMVFVNTAENAVVFAQALRDAGQDCTEFHKLVDSRVREDNLRQFRVGEVSVMVCTDSAARGLDLPNVRLVIQAEFALNVVQHLHRVGRASRAGAMGRATNIYDEQSRELVESILSEGEGEGSVEQSFSRRRGFRQKIKKGRN